MSTYYKNVVHSSAVGLARTRLGLLRFWSCRLSLIAGFVLLNFDHLFG
jgi:hypothetical protein